MFMPPVFPAHWHVSQPVLIADTFSSLVWKVSLPDGTPAIVKGLKPIEDIADELRGADYLVWRNGRGAVRLLGRENNLMLLEYAGERMLSHIVAEHGDYQATEIAAELMAKLYAASEEPLPSALLPILDALHRWRTHSLVRWTSIRVACSTRRTLMGAFPQLGTRMEKRSNAI